MSDKYGNPVPSSFLSIDTLRTRSGSVGPDLTFGIEMELDFAMARHLYFEWLATNPVIPEFSLSTTLDDLPTRLKDHRPSAKDLFNDTVARGKFPDSPTLIRAARRDSQSTNSTRSRNLRHNLMFYFLDFLNMKLPSSDQSQKKLLIGEVTWGGAPKTASADTWTLVHDDSLGPSRRQYGDYIEPKQTYDMIRQFFRCVGAELVSKIYLLSELDAVRPALQQLQERFTPENNGQAHEAFSTTREHLHVHFGIKDREITVGVAQNLCALYGLFEHQIDKWLSFEQRGNFWCRSMRKGMHNRRMVITDTLTGGVDLEYLPERRYTPMEYCEGIYECKTFEELKTWCSGFSRGEALYAKSKDYKGDLESMSWSSEFRHYMAVNISLPRENKKATFEFRQHHGSTDAVEISFWIELCGHMLRFAYLLDEAGMQLKNPDIPRGALEGVDRPTFLEIFLKQDLLDIIGLPKNAKEHFKSQEEKFFDGQSDDDRFKEELLIRKRIVMLKSGRETGLAMDADILSSEPYLYELEQHGFGLPPPTPPRVLTGTEHITITGLLNVFEALVPDVIRYAEENYSYVIKAPVPEKGDRLSRKEIYRFSLLDDTGQIAAWLAYSDYIHAEDIRRDANRGSRYWPLSLLQSFWNGKGKAGEEELK